ncbi:sigma-54-dependent Fis family transcriptional regulator [candidate division KSB1 bacterium]|nr:sigma-54-dependent Fis family transcriptional regulator [candidate division KSB1 bacterium]
MKLGAYDYLNRPIDWNKLKISVKNALTTKELKNEVSRLKSQLRSRYKIANIVGKSQKMKAVLTSAERILKSDVPVNIYGEDGTGKELLARTIHYQGQRKEKPFVSINCESIPEHLLESELFGHEPGVFPGAISRRIGKLEQADQGTLFLDEVGHLSSALQVKLLHVLQEGEFERFGGTEKLKADVRLITATKFDLMDEVKAYRFREDLYYRLCVYPIRIPH